MKNKKLTERQRDICILLVMALLSGLVVYLMIHFMFWETLGLEWHMKSPFIYIWYILLLYPIVVSYLESRDKDPFVGGKTQKMGVVNSFIVSVCLIAVMSDGLKSWVFSTIIVSVCLFIARELGRRASNKLEKKYLNKTGIMLSDLHNKGTAEIDGKEVKVWSCDDIKKGTRVRITEIKGNYLYVKSGESGEQDEI